MNKEKLRGLGRRALILLLLAAAVLLLREAGSSAGIRRQLRSGESEAAEPVSGTESAGALRPAGAVQPVAAVVNLEGGGHFGAAYAAEPVSEIFQRFSADLGEALGSAGAPEPMSEEEFCAALCRCGVYLKLPCSQPLELLAAWLGAEFHGEECAELLCLSAGENAVSLCCRTGEGEYFQCATAAAAERLRSRTEEFADNGVSFAFSDPLLRDGDPCAPVCAGGRSAAEVKLSPTQLTASETDALLRSLGMNSFISGSYYEADGTEVFIDEESTLRLSPSGGLSFRRPGFPENMEALSRVETVSLARRIAESVLGACGDGALIFAGVSYGEAQRSYTVCFDYAVNGIPVRLGSGHAAELVLRGEKLMQARMQLCRFALTGETVPLLPDRQALALAAAEHTGAALCYRAGGETMNCDWERTDG